MTKVKIIIGIIALFAAPLVVLSLVEKYGIGSQVRGIGGVLLGIVGTLLVMAWIGWMVSKVTDWNWADRNKRDSSKHLENQELGDRFPSSGLDSTVELESLVGNSGLAKTALRPSGYVTVGGRPYHALTQGEFIAKDSPVQVVRVEEGVLFVEELKHVF